MKQIRSWLLPIKELYICGVNVLDDSTASDIAEYDYELEPEEMSDVDNRGVKYAQIKSAKLSHHVINGYEFYIATSKVESFYLVTLFGVDMLDGLDIDEKTYTVVQNYMLSQLTTNYDAGEIYSPKKQYRVILEKREDGLVSYIIQKTCVNAWAMVDFPYDTMGIYGDYFYFEFLSYGIYDTWENAILNAKMELAQIECD